MNRYIYKATYDRVFKRIPSICSRSLFRKYIRITFEKHFLPSVCLRFYSNTILKGDFLQDCNKRARDRYLNHHTLLA